MKSQQLFAVGLILTICLSGCAGIKDTMRVSEKNSQWNPVRHLTESKAEEAEPTIPNTLTVLWKESVYEMAGSKSVRGFGGRVFFHDENNNPVEADGELSIYGYDESKDNLNSKTADKKFVFTSEELKSSMGDSGLGTSYNVWIPWDEVGGIRKTIALIPMFKTNDEVPRVIKSGQSLNILHGTVPGVSDVTENRPYKVLGSSPAVVKQGDNTKPSDVANSSIALASFESNDAEKANIKTSTIRMSPGMAQRIAKQSAPRKDTSYALGGNWDPDAITTPAPTVTAESSQDLETETSSGDWISNLKQQASESTHNKVQRNVFGAPGTFK